MSSPDLDDLLRDVMVAGLREMITDPDPAVADRAADELELLDPYDPTREDDHR